LSGSREYPGIPDFRTIHASLPQAKPAWPALAAGHDSENSEFGIAIPNVGQSSARGFYQISVSCKSSGSELLPSDRYDCVTKNTEAVYSHPSMTAYA
jgi:hypothetical protein